MQMPEDPQDRAAPAAPRRSSLSTRPVSTGRTGLIAGAAVVLAMLLAFALWWRGTGVDEAEPPAAPVAADSAG